MKKTISLLLACALAFTITVFAKSSYENITRYYNNIKIELNGQEIVPQDVNGNIVEPFIIDGTTYLPVRAIGSAMNLTVDWDPDNNTVLLYGEASNNKDNSYDFAINSYAVLFCLSDINNNNSTIVRNLSSYHLERSSDYEDYVATLVWASLNANEKHIKTLIDDGLLDRWKQSSDSQNASTELVYNTIIKYINSVKEYNKMVMFYDENAFLMYSRVEDEYSQLSNLLQDLLHD